MVTAAPLAMAAASNVVLVWNVAFLSSDGQGWWGVFSPRWCRHVVAYGYAPATDSWLVIENTPERAVLLSFTFEEFDGWLEQLRRRAPVVLRYTARDAPAHAHRFGVWCSTMIARFCGVSGGAWRPLALYRSLRRDGAECVFGIPPDGPGQSQSSEGRSGDEAPA